METGNTKIHFNKGEASVTLDITTESKTIETRYQVDLGNFKDEYFVEIPAFNISISSKKKEGINQKIHDSVFSFFNFKLDKQGLDKFIITMLELGFEIKSVSKNVMKSHTRLKHINTQEISEKFILI